MSDGEEIHLAGGVHGSEPYRGENGAVMGLHYIRSTITLARANSSATDCGVRCDVSQGVPNAIPDNEEEVG